MIISQILAGNPLANSKSSYKRLGKNEILKKAIKGRQSDSRGQCDE